MSVKVRLEVRRERYEAVRAALAEHGIEVDDEAELVLRERDAFSDTLLVREGDTGARVVLPVGEIVSIETRGRGVEVCTAERVYQTGERLYQLAAALDPEKFLRVSNSSVIARDKVRRITPTLSMRFILTMADGRRVDVTRSYYYMFKEAFGI